MNYHKRFLLEERLPRKIEERRNWLIGLYGSEERALHYIANDKQLNVLYDQADSLAKEATFPASPSFQSPSKVMHHLSQLSPKLHTVRDCIA